MTDLTITEQLRQSIDARLAQTPIKFHSSAEIITARQSTCDTCPQKMIQDGIEHCAACGCAIALKTQLNNAQCPLKKWVVTFIPNEPIPTPQPAEPPSTSPLPDGIDPVDPIRPTLITLMLPTY
jgi:hypothetical protein